MSLSRRFGGINPVGVDSTEEDTDNDDDQQILRNLLGRKDSRFKYSDPARLSFDGRPRDSTESSDEDDRLQEDMAPDWLEEFQTILKNSTTSTVGTPARRPLLLDRASPEICHAPLDALRVSVERYQHKDNDLENQVVPEKNDDMPEDDSSVRANKGEVPSLKKDRNFIGESVTSEDKEKSFTIDNSFNQDVPNKESKHTKGNLETTIAQNHSTENDIKLTKKVKLETESIEKCSKISQEGNESDLSRKNSGAAKTFHKKKHAISKSGENKPVGSLTEKGDKKVKDSTKEHKMIPKVSVNDKKVSDKSSKIEQKDKHAKKEVRFNLEVKSELGKTPVENKIKSVPPKDTKAKEQVKNSSDLKVSDTSKNVLVISGLESPKHTGNMEDDAETIVLTSAEGTSGVCKDKGTTSHKTIAKKDTQDECFVKSSVTDVKPKASPTLPPYKSDDFKKTKTYNITPSSSFPLDELLPVKKKSSTEGNHVKNSSKDQRKRHNTGELVKQQSQENNNRSVQAVEPSEHRGNHFYGTVYDGSDVPDVYPQYQEYTETSSYEAENCKMSHFVNKNLTGIMSAIQSGNPEVISSIQEALYREIGLNLQALAATAKPQIQPDTIVVPEHTVTPPLGFYTERSVAEDRQDLPSASGDNRSADVSVDGKQSEELFHLFVQQCKELVQTQEDKAKLMSLVNVLKNESGNSLTSTGFTPPDADKLLHVTETVTDCYSADSEQASPDSMLAGANNLLFEGRTMLKGGVKPRHIPKTTIHKLGKGRPLDPRRLKDILESDGMFIQLPPFVREMWGEKRLKKILALSETPVQKSSSSTFRCYNPQKELYSRPTKENDEAKIKITITTEKNCDSKSVKKSDNSGETRKSFDKNKKLSKESISKTLYQKKASIDSVRKPSETSIEKSDNSRTGKIIKKNEIKISVRKPKDETSSVKNISASHFDRKPYESSNVKLDISKSGNFIEKNAKQIIECKPKDEASSAMTDLVRHHDRKPYETSSEKSDISRSDKVIKKNEEKINECKTEKDTKTATSRHPDRKSYEKSNEQSKQSDNSRLSCNFFKKNEETVIKNKTETDASPIQSVLARDSGEKQASLDEHITSCNFDRFSSTNWTPVDSFSSSSSEEMNKIPVMISINHNDKKVDSDKRPTISKQPTLITIKPLDIKESGDCSKGNKTKRSTSPSGTNRKVISMELDSDSEVEETLRKISRDKTVTQDLKTAGKEFKKSSHEDNGKEGGELKLPLEIQEKNKSEDGKVSEKNANADMAVRGKMSYTETNKGGMTQADTFEKDIKMNYDGKRDEMKYISMEVNKHLIPVEKEIIERRSVERHQKDRISVNKEIIERRSVDRNQKIEWRSVDRNQKGRISLNKEIIERRSVDRNQKERISFDNETKKRRIVDRNQKKRISVDKEIIDRKSVERKQKDRISVEKEIVERRSVDRNQRERISDDKEIIDRKSVERKQKDRISVDTEIVDRKSVERNQKEKISFEWKQKERKPVEWKQNERKPAEGKQKERKPVEWKQKYRMSTERVEDKEKTARPSHPSRSHRVRHVSTSSMDSLSAPVLPERTTASRSVASPASRHRHRSSITTKCTDRQAQEKPSKPAKESEGSRDRKRHRTAHELQDSESKKRKYTAVPDEKRRYSHGDSRNYSSPNGQSQQETLANSGYLGKITVSWPRDDRLPDYDTSGHTFHGSQHIQEGFYDNGRQDLRQKLNSQNILDLTKSEESKYKLSACPKQSKYKRTKLGEDQAALDNSRRVIFRETESVSSSSDAEPTTEPRNYVLNDSNIKDAGKGTAPMPKKVSKSLEEDRNFLEGFKRKLSGDKVELDTTITVAELKREREDRLFLQNCKKGLLGKAELSKIENSSGGAGGSSDAAGGARGWTGGTSGGTGRAKATSSASRGALSYNDMLNLADLEDV